jgi:hypothetical protein
VVAGSCPVDVSIWDSQRCNPVAHSHSFPHDTVFVMYGTPLLAQVLLRGTTMWGILGAYVVAFSAVGFAMVVTDGYVQMYTLLWGPLIFIFIAYEIERLMRVAFVRNALLIDGRRALVESAKHEAKLQHEHATAQHLARKEEELMRRWSRPSPSPPRHLALPPTTHTRASTPPSPPFDPPFRVMYSIMGNVAHDMKTPLHSINAELECIVETVTEGCKDLMRHGEDVGSIADGIKLKVSAATLTLFYPSHAHVGARTPSRCSVMRTAWCP